MSKCIKINLYQKTFIKSTHYFCNCETESKHSQAFPSQSIKPDTSDPEYQDLLFVPEMVEAG